MKPYVITLESYEDYHIHTVLLGDDGHSVSALGSEFIAATGWREYDLYRESEQYDVWCQRWSDEYGFDERQSDHNLFIEWLVREKGFRRTEWGEIHFGDFEA